MEHQESAGDPREYPYYRAMNSNRPAGNSAKKTPGSLPAGCLTLFGLPFAAAGIFVLVKGIRESSEHFSREVIIQLMTGLLFACVGLGIVVFSLFLRRSQKKASERQQLFPTSPWLWREDWANSTIRSNQRTAALFMCLFAFVWNGISWTVATAFFMDRDRLPKGVFLLVLLFPAIGIVLAIGAVTRMLTWRRFRTATFRIATLPARPGGVLQGYIDLPLRLPLEIPVKLRLNCIQREQQSSGGENRTVDHTLWQEEKLLRGPFPELGLDQTTLPVFFRLPSDQPDCGGDRSANAVSWTLEAIAALPGPDLNIGFDIPVFSASGPQDPAPREDPTTRYQMPVTELRESIKSKIIVRDSVDGKELVFPALRNPGTVVFSTLFFLGWTTVVVFLAKSSAPILFPIVFGLFNVLIGFFWFNLTFRQSRLTANRQRVVSRQRWLFFERVKEWPVSSIRNISLKVGMSSNQQRFYDLTVVLDTGRSTTLACAIPSKIEADWLAAELGSALQLPPDQVQGLSEHGAPPPTTNPEP
jgi:hypothetical protein